MFFKNLKNQIADIDKTIIMKLFMKCCYEKSMIIPTDNETQKLPKVSFPQHFPLSDSWSEGWKKYTNTPFHRNITWSESHAYFFFTL